jgi:hypothetical protein
METTAGCTFSITGAKLGINATLRSLASMAAGASVATVFVSARATVVLNVALNVNAQTPAPTAASRLANSGWDNSFILLLRLEGMSPQLRDRRVHFHRTRQN